MFKVKDIIKICNAKLLNGDIEKEVNSFSTDTRTINKDDTYVAIKGSNFDGNDFYFDAIKKGVSICILDKEVSDYTKYKDTTFLLVDNTIECLQQLASYKISKFNGRVIAVTGSVGKTSTKDMIYSVVSKKYKTLKTSGNNNNHIGLPLTILKLTDEEVIILEMGMNNLNEISLLSKIARPDIAVITNVGYSHIGNLGSRGNILKAKLEILDGLKSNGKLIINNDNDMLNKYYLENINDNIITIGIDNMSNYTAKDIKYNNDIVSYNVDNINVIVNIPSKAFIYNSLFAYAIGNILNIDSNLIIDGIGNFSLSKNRLDIKEKDDIVIIDDTYNASYESIENSLNILKLRNEKRKILVLGDILELGEYSSYIHKKLAKLIMNTDIDILLLVGSDIKYTYDELIKNNYNKKIYIFNKYDETYKVLDSILDKGDVILLKASHGIQLTKVVNYLLNGE